jgi:hypothetical protein
MTATTRLVPSLLALLALSAGAFGQSYNAGAYSGTGGNANTYVGPYAGQYNGTPNNTFIGFAAGQFSSGSGNTYLGYFAGYWNNSAYNTFVGHLAGSSQFSTGIFSNNRQGAATPRPRSHWPLLLEHLTNQSSNQID